MVAAGQATNTCGWGRTTSELQAPSGYSGICANCDIDVNGLGEAEDPWILGANSHYRVRDRGPLAPADQR